MSHIRHTNGDRAVLFIHGFLGSPHQFDVFVPLVPQDCAVYNLQLKGHGGSVRDFAKASMQEWKDQVESVMQELTARYRDIYIVAHSMGTLFAMTAAVRYPTSVKQLLLLQPPLKIALNPRSIAKTVRAIPENSDAALAFRKANGVRLSLRFWEYFGWLPRYFELFAEARHCREVIRRVAVLCTVFQSAQDELVSLGSVDFIPCHSGFRVRILKDSGHFIYSDRDFEQIRDAFLSFF